MVYLTLYLYALLCLALYVWAAERGFSRTGFDLAWRIATAPILVPILIIAAFLKGPFR